MGAAVLGRHVLPPALVANVLFLTPLLVATALLNAHLDVWLARDALRRGLEARFLVAAFVWFLALGLIMTRVVGEHAGDEGHYLIQARSLWFDGDLDIANNLRAEGALVRGHETEPKVHHASPFSRDGHWYSWHLPGLCFLLAPTVPLGVVARHVVLAAIATSTLFGVLCLCRRTGAHAGASLVVTALFGLGIFWSVYAARALPETLGASLLVWLVWAMAAYAQRPLLSVSCAAGCCIALFWTQSRFGPLALLGGGLFGLRILTAAQPWSTRIKYAAGFGLVAVVGAAHFLMLQRRFFEGGLPLKSSDYLFNYWPGLYLGLLSERGLLYSLPAIAWMLPALAYWLVLDRANRFVAIAAASLFTVNAVLSTSNNIFTGGECLPGRYHLCVVPLLLPACAHLLPRISGWARGWFVFLSGFGIGALVLMVLALPALRKGFMLPLGNVEQVWPLFRGLLHPWASQKAFYAGGPGVALGLGFGVTLFAASTLLMGVRPRRWTNWGVVALVIVATVAGHLGNAR